MDTVLVKILAKSDDTAELNDLINHTNNIVLSDVEQSLKDNNQYSVLCRLYKKIKNDKKLLEAYSKSVFCPIGDNRS